MIFGLIRLTIWLAGMLVVAFFVLTILGYSVDWDYLTHRRAQCESALRQCQSDLVKTGLEGVQKKCQWHCFDLQQLIVKKK